MTDLYALKFKALWSALKQEHLSFWFLVIYLFFEYIRPQTLYPIIDVLPYSKIFLGLSIISAFSDPSVKWVSGFGNKLLFVYTLVIVLSAFFAFKPSASADNYLFFLNWLILYFLILCVINTETRLFLFMCAFLLVNLKMAQHGFFSWMQRGFSFASYGLIGSPGWFRNSGEFAVEMLIFSPLAMGFVIALRSHWSRNKKWLMYFLPLSGIASIIGSSSRGGQLGLLAIALWLVIKSKKRLKAVMVVFILVSLFVLLLPAKEMHRFDNMGNDKTSLQRLAYWQFGLDIMNKYPVLGIGYYNWEDYSLFMKPEGMGPLKLNELPHNIFIQAGAELGYTGLVVFIMMIIIAFIYNISTRRMMRDTNNFIFHLSYGLDAGLIGFLVSGFFVTVLYYPFFWVQYAMIMSVHSIAKKVYIERAAEVKRSGIKNKFTVRDG